jgi:hypothetical protein
VILYFHVFRDIGDDGREILCPRLSMSKKDDRELAISGWGRFPFSCSTSKQREDGLRRALASARFWAKQRGHQVKPMTDDAPGGDLTGV